LAAKMSKRRTQRQVDLSLSLRCEVSEACCVEMTFSLW
jgi:hypothetical protein